MNICARTGQTPATLNNLKNKQRTKNASCHVCESTQKELCWRLMTECPCFTCLHSFSCCIPETITARVVDKSKKPVLCRIPIWASCITSIIRRISPRTKCETKQQNRSWAHYKSSVEIALFVQVSGWFCLIFLSMNGRRLESLEQTANICLHVVVPVMSVFELVTGMLLSGTKLVQLQESGITTIQSVKE